MSSDALRSAVYFVANQLARGEYDSLVNHCANSRLTSDDLRRVISNYGRKLKPPPADAYDKLDAVRMHDTVLPMWSVHAPLWTEEEGYSDLTLELTITLGPDSTRIELDDLEVL